MKENKRIRTVFRVQLRLKGQRRRNKRRKERRKSSDHMIVYQQKMVVYRGMNQSVTFHETLAALFDDSTTERDKRQGVQEVTYDLDDQRYQDKSFQVLRKNKG